MTILAQYHSSQFKPNLLSYILNPFWIARNSIYDEMKKIASSKYHDKILDVGCGMKPYASLFKFNQYIGLEYDTERGRNNSKADLFYKNNSFPLQDNEFDLIISNQVLEHVSDADSFLKEIHRVLKRDGKVILTAPFCWDEHEQPFDFARYTSFGLKSILEKNGFEILNQKKIAPGFLCITQLFTGYLFKVTLPKNNNKIKRGMFLLFTVVCISPINFIGFLISKIIPQNADLYLDNVIIAKK